MISLLKIPAKTERFAMSIKDEKSKAMEKDKRTMKPPLVAILNLLLCNCHFQENQILNLQESLCMSFPKITHTKTHTHTK